MELQRFPQPLPNSPTLLLGIVGHPLGHTLSPVLHNWALQEAGVSGVYCRWELPPGALPQMLTAVRTLPIHGLSVTIPHKVTIMPLLDRITPFAGQVGAVNTVYWEGGQLWGDNTDVEGFLTPLRELTAFDSALVLGAGGAARAALAGLADLASQGHGMSRIGIANRNPEKSQDLARTFHVQHVPWEERTDFGASLLVNATPLGMLGERRDLSPWPAEAWQGVAAAYDLVYNPLRTRFLLDARAAGAQTVEGLRMFLGQAQCQFSRWTGATFPMDTARRLLLEALREQG